MFKCVYCKGLCRCYCCLQELVFADQGPLGVEVGDMGWSHSRQWDLLDLSLHVELQGEAVDDLWVKVCGVDLRSQLCGQFLQTHTHAHTQQRPQGYSFVHSVHLTEGSVQACPTQWVMVGSEDRVLRLVMGTQWMGGYTRSSKRTVHVMRMAERWPGGRDGD